MNTQLRTIARELHTLLTQTPSTPYCFAVLTGTPVHEIKDLLSRLRSEIDRDVAQEAIERTTMTHEEEAAETYLRR